MPRPRDRKSANGLLPRMEARPWKDGKRFTYRYLTLENKWLKLGTDLPEALRKVLDLNCATDGYGTLLWGWEAYKQSARWKRLAPVTQDDYEAAWRQINPRLGHMHMGSITTPIIARYVHIERADAPKRANTEKSLLSRIFGHAIKLGICNINPTLGVESHPMEPRDTLPKADVLARFLAWLQRQTPQQQVMGMMAEYCALAGSRRTEFLPLEWDWIDLDAGEIKLARGKQRGRLRGTLMDVVVITPPLHSLLLRLLEVREARGTGCVYVFPNEDNNKYSESGFKAMWARCVAAAMKAGVFDAKDRFAFHDLRAYYATYHKVERGDYPDLHTNKATTARVYGRGKEVRRSALISHDGKLKPSRNDKTS